MIIALGVVAYLISWVIAARVLKKYLLIEAYEELDIKNNTAPSGAVKPSTWCIYWGAVWPFSLVMFMLILLANTEAFIAIKHLIIRIVLGRTK